jgi:hypothetical protein
MQVWVLDIWRKIKMDYRAYKLAATAHLDMEECQGVGIDKRWHGNGI